MLKNRTRDQIKAQERMGEEFRARAQTCNQVPAAAREDRRPAKSRVLFSWNTLAMMIPFCIVLVTCVPISRAPENSSTAAVSTAWRMVRAPEPTEVPIALATSLAPMFQAM